MHHALEIQEILLNIFGHCWLPSWESFSDVSDLSALARTCRAFKEPALDVLWEELIVASPIARCLPEACHRSHFLLGRSANCYSLHRSLTEIEWVTLRSYTYRIRSILDVSDTLDWESVRTFLNLPTTEPLFPNLRYLCVSQSTEIKTKHILYMPFPSLTSLDVRTISKDNLYSLLCSLESFSTFSPHIRNISIYFCKQPQHIDVTFSNLVSSYICRWRDLKSVDFGFIALDVDALVHLSRLPALTRLSCTPSAAFPPSDSPIFFTNLHHLTLYSKLLGPISQLFSRIRLPAVVHVTSFIYRRPSKQCFSFFLASVQTSVIGHAIQELQLELKEEEALQEAEEATDIMPVLGFRDLQPFMTFSNLHRIYIGIGWKVDLSDRELLTLASTWPHLEQLLINVEWGWKTPGGITPNGLLQLLRTCRSLSNIALVIDTRGYTEFRESPANLGLTMPPRFSIDVLDSTLAAESIPAIAAFLAGIAFHSSLDFTASKGWFMDETDEMGRWYDAYNRSYDLLDY